MSSEMANKKIRQFDYAGRQLIVSCDVLESTDSAVIVVPTSQLLSSENEVTLRIYQQAGAAVQLQIDQLRREYDEFDIGMAVFTDPGKLSYSAIIHAISHPLEDAPAANLIELAYTNSLLVCEFNGWHSIAFERLYAGKDKHCAHAAARAIIRFWDARMDSEVETVMLCFPEEQFETYVEAIEAINAGPLRNANQQQGDKNSNQSAVDESSSETVVVGELDLSQEDLTELEDDATISDWFSQNKD